MKTEEIAEKAREYAEFQVPKNKILMHNVDRRRGIQQGYIKGYEACNAEWQEKVRWIPVEERLPITKDEFGNTKQVLAKCYSPLFGLSGIFVAYYNNVDNCFYNFDGQKLLNVISWREIIE